MSWASELGSEMCVWRAACSALGGAGPAVCTGWHARPPGLPAPPFHSPLSLKSVLPLMPPQVCFSTVASLLKKCNVRPKDVGIVIVNCSLFSPTPSLTATIMNHFKMPSTTIGYNLSGMGCSGARLLSQGP